MHSGRPDHGTAPRWGAPVSGGVEGGGESQGVPHLYQALPDTRKNASRSKGLNLGPWSL